MKHPLALFFFIPSLLLLGCATMDGSRGNQNTREFRLHFDTDPQGATLLFESPDGRVRRAGETPRDLTFRFIRVQDPTVMGYLGKSVWKPVNDPATPWVVSQEGEVFVARIHNLRVEKNGFEPETFSTKWEIPITLRERNEQELRSFPVPDRREETFVIRRPMRPQQRKTITFESLSGPAELYILNQNGTLGERLGALPYAAQIGFAPLRDEEGKTVDWRLWTSGPRNKWTLAQNGNLSFRGVLVAEGYEPMVFEDFLVMNLHEAANDARTVPLAATRPANPEAAFTLLLDSLPGNADIFVLRQDRTLGEKLGQTPVEIVIGLAQQRKQDKDNNLLHEDWIIWAPENLVLWETMEDGTTNFYIQCALYREGYSPEFVSQKIFSLTPGRPYPEQKTLTVPLFRPEHAAAREAQARRVAPQPTPVPEPRVPPSPGFIWREPEPTPIPAQEPERTWRDRLRLR